MPRAVPIVTVQLAAVIVATFVPSPPRWLPGLLPHRSPPLCYGLTQTVSLRPTIAQLTRGDEMTCASQSPKPTLTPTSMPIMTAVLFPGTVNCFLQTKSLGDLVAVSAFHYMVKAAGCLCLKANAQNSPSLCWRLGRG